MTQPVGETVSLQDPVPAPTMESILGVELPSELDPWAIMPLAVEKVESTDGEVYKATWPDLKLVRSINNQLESLTVFLNLAAPTFNDDYGTIDDLSLQTRSGGFTQALRDKHAASFGRAWEKHEAYAHRAHAALMGKPSVDRAQVEVDGIRYWVIEAGILGFDEEVEGLRSKVKFFPKDELLKIFDKYDAPYPDKLVSDSITALTAPGTYKNLEVSDSVIAPKAVSDLLDRHPEAAVELLEASGAVVFDGGRPYGGLLVAYGIDLSRQELEAKFAGGDGYGVRTYQDDDLTFQYILAEEDEELAPVYPTAVINDPRPHLQPVLYWKVDADGRREIIYDAETSTRTVREGQVTYEIVEDPMLGTLIPFIFSPKFRADEEQWPKMDSLPTDKTRQKSGEIENLPANNIGPANVVLQAIRKRRAIIDHFPFERLEAIAG